MHGQPTNVTALALTEIVATPTVKQATQAALSDAAATLADLRAFRITDDRGVQTVGQVVTGAKARWETIEAERRKLVAPINAAHAAVQTLCKPALDEWAAVEREGKTKIGAYELAKVEERRRLEAAAEAAHAAGAPAAQVQALVVASSAPVAHAAGVSTRLVWVGEVTDLGALVKAVAEGKAPLGLLTVDDRALAALATDSQGSRTIAGVRFAQRTVVRASRRG
jgi:flavin-binding protein dodecin